MASDDTGLAVAKSTFSRMGLMGIVIFVIEFVGGLIAGCLIGSLVPFFQDGQFVLIISTLITIALAYPVGYLTVRKLRCDYPEAVQSGPRMAFALFGLCMLSATIGELMLAGILSFSGGPSFHADPSVLSSGISGDMTLVSIVYACILGPVAEELVFRKAIIDRTRMYGNGFAIIASALVFSLLHMNGFQFLPTFLLGCAFGYAYIATGGIRYSIGLHVANNVLALVTTVLIENCGISLHSCSVRLFAIPQLFRIELMSLFTLFLLLVVYGSAMLALFWLINGRRTISLELVRGTRVSVRSTTIIANPGMIALICMSFAMVYAPVVVA